MLDASPHWPGAIGNVGHVRMTFARNKQKVLDLWRAGRGDLAWEVTTSAETSPGAETVAQSIRLRKQSMWGPTLTGRPSTTFAS